MNTTELSLISIKLMLTSVLFLALSWSLHAADEDQAWIEEMKTVHANFKGTKGSFAIFGDSISDTKAYMAALAWGMPTFENDEQKKHFETLKNYTDMKKFHSNKGPKFGNLSRMRVSWALKGMDNWIKQLKPEACIFMFGTNDVKGSSIEDFDRDLRACMDKLKASGCVCILSTIPPFHNQDERVKAINDKIRAVAKEYKLLLQDFHKEIMDRRPDDWSGKLEKFGKGGNYDVETLIARDGVHPSNPKKYGSKNFTEESMKHSGFSLRNYLAVRDFSKVITEVLNK